MFAGVIGSSGSGGPIITVKQTWSGLQFNTSTVSTRAYTNQPVAGNLLVAVIGVPTASLPASLSDDLGDGVSWTELVGPAIRGTLQERLFYKVVGTPVGTGKTVTVTRGTAGVAGLYIAEFTTDRATTWAVDGTPVSVNNVTGANPTPGNITTTGSSSVVIGAIEKAISDPTPADGYTAYESGGTPWFSGTFWVEHRIVTTPGVQTPSWIAASSAYSALGAAFKAS